MDTDRLNQPHKKDLIAELKYLESFSKNAVAIHGGEIVTTETQWLRKAVSNGMKALVGAKLNGTPDYESLSVIKEVWIKAFIKRRNGNWTPSDIDDIETAFLTAIEQCDWFPSPKTVLDFLPHREKQEQSNPKKSMMPANIKTLWHTALHDALTKEEKEKTQRKKEFLDAIYAKKEQIAEQLDAHIEVEMLRPPLQFILTHQKKELKEVLKQLLTPEQQLEIGI